MTQQQEYDFPGDRIAKTLSELRDAIQRTPLVSDEDKADTLAAIDKASAKVKKVSKSQPS